MTVDDLCDVKSCVVAPLKVDFDLSVSLESSHAMEIDFNLNSLEATQRLSAPTVFGFRSWPSASSRTHFLERSKALITDSITAES